MLVKFLQICCLKKHLGYSYVKMLNLIVHVAQNRKMHQIVFLYCVLQETSL